MNNLTPDKGIITRKGEVVRILDECLSKDPNKFGPDFIHAVQSGLLKEKVRFPLLEFAARLLYNKIPEGQQIAFLDEIIALAEIGCYVIAGMILQLRLQTHFEESHTKAREYIIKGNEWYVCDIIGERVMGHSLLIMPDKTLPLLGEQLNSPEKWQVRCVGVASHYAVKKGLKKQYVEEMFALLLSQATVTEFHTKKGMGWAVKTIAKFHPEIIEKNRNFLTKEAGVRPWFLTKIKIGLGRTSKYAGRYKD